MRTSRRNNIIAGTFLLVCLVLAIVVSVVLSDARRRLIPKSRYVVRFGLAEGATGLLTGSAVQIGGREVGTVAGVDFAYERPGQPRVPTSVDVAIAIPERIVLYENAVATLSRPLIGSMSAINIIDLGDPAEVEVSHGTGPVLEPGETLDGRLAPPAFLAQAGFGQDEAMIIRDVVTRIDEIVDRFEDISVVAKERVGPILEDAEQIVANVREHEPEWADRIDATLTRLDRASADASAAIEELRAGVADADGLITEARAAIEENRPQLDNIVDRVESVSEKLDSETVDLFNASLANVDESSAEFAELGRNANELLTRQAPDIRRALANTRLASDQLKLAMVEIRRNPWRLLYRPSTKETRTEVLYDAARAYAAAVSDLRAASESLEAAAAAEGADREEVDRLIGALGEAFERFERTERRLVDRLIED